MRVLIVDDEHLARALLRELLGAHPDVEIVGECENGFEAVKAIGEGAGEALLPPMILQPLVENAVKHGIGSLPQGGTVRIAARREGSLLRVLIENDVDADLPAAAPGKGIGLANVRQRLTAVYGHEASVNWTREQQQFRVTLALPFDTTEL